MKRFKLIILLVSVLLASYAVTGFAVMYKYVDEKGTVILTSDRQSIPAKYQSNVEIIEEHGAPDGFSPEGGFADEIRQKRKSGGSAAQSERSNARWYKENPDIEPSLIGRLKLYIKDLWSKYPFGRSWPAGAAALWVTATFAAGRFIVSRSKRRQFFFFSILTAMTFLVVMYAWILR